MSDLEDLQRRVIAFRDAKDWKQFHNPKTVLSLWRLKPLNFWNTFSGSLHRKLKTFKRQ